MLNERDRAIIRDLNRFRVMDRDSICEIHFAGLKNPRQSANNVLLRLLRESEIQRSTAFYPYAYFGPEVSMKKNSAKIGHFLAILEVYKEMRRLGTIESFSVEPKYGKKSEAAEPDIFCIFRNENGKRAQFFIEVQRTVYSEKLMQEKIDRYVDLYNSGMLQEPTPHLLILSDQRYAIDGSYPFRIFQAQSFTEFHNSLKPVPQPVVVNGGLKLKTVIK